MTRLNRRDRMPHMDHERTAAYRSAIHPPWSQAQVLRDFGRTKTGCGEPIDVPGIEAGVGKCVQRRIGMQLEFTHVRDDANRYLREIYLPRHNEQFRVKPASEISAFVAVAGFDIGNILCIQEDRVVGADNTVRYLGMKLQIPPSSHRHHFVKTQVRVHQYPDNTLAIFHGPRQIGRYNSNGTQKQEENKNANRKAHRTYHASTNRTFVFALDRTIFKAMLRDRRNNKRVESGAPQLILMAPMAR